MKILVPTDFSHLSKIAIDYAIQLGMKFKADLVLLSVVFIEGPGRGSLQTKDLEEVLISDARNACIQLIEEFKTKYNSRINYEVTLGYPVGKIIKNYAVNNGVDLIVMGTKGATGIKKIFLGSNAFSVIDKSNVPVIAVPEFATFKSLNDIVYATDIFNLKDELEKVISFARKFNARIHILHVTSPREQEAIEPKEMMETIIKTFRYNHISFAVSHADDPEEGIEEYIARNKIDLLAMFTHELSFFEKLFGRGITRKVALHNHIPLLTFKKNES